MKYRIFGYLMYDFRNKSRIKEIIYIMLSLVIIPLFIHSEESDSQKRNRLTKTTITSDTRLDVNRMNGLFRNNGTWFYDNMAGNWGLEWPKGSGLSPIFAAGQWVAAKFPDSTIRVAGVQHSATEYQPGQILEPFSWNLPRIYCPTRRRILQHIDPATFAK